MILKIAKIIFLLMSINIVAMEFHNNKPQKDEQKTEDYSEFLVKAGAAIEAEMELEADIAMQARGFDNQHYSLLVKNCPPNLQELLSKYNKTVRNFPTAILFVGEPGTGKSTLARAIAIKAGVKYEFIACPSIANEFKSSGVQNLERIFNPAIKSKKPRVIILDEINELFHKFNNPNDTDHGMVMKFWQLFDELSVENPHALVIATSNDAEKMPCALQSRLGIDTFEIKVPSNEARAEIIKYYLDKSSCKYDEKVISLLSKRTSYCSGRSIEKFVKRMILLSPDHGINPKITQIEVEKVLCQMQSSMRLLGSKHESPCVKKMKKYLKITGPHILPTVNTLLSILSFGINCHAMYRQNFYSAQQLMIAKEQLKIAQNQLAMGQVNTEIAKKSLKNQEEALFLQKLTAAATMTPYVIEGAQAILNLCIII